MIDYFDHISSTSLFSKKNDELIDQWDHKCTVPKLERLLPVVVPNQSLRNLRHRHGHKHEQGRFASCVHCDELFTHEDLVGVICPDF